MTEDYAFLMPLGCLFVRDVIGHTPIAFLVGKPDEWTGRLAVVVEALRRHCIRFEFVDHIEGQSDATVAQNVRHHTAALPDLDENEWLMLNDADLWMLRREFYHLHEGIQGKLVVLYSNGDHFKSK